MATAKTPQSQASNSVTALNQFLAIAPERPYSIFGTIPSGSTGGSTSQVIWQQQIPTVAAFCTSIDYTITLPVELVLPASGSATHSMFAPYSAVGNQLTLGGAPPWNMTEFTPWYLDGLTRYLDYDPAYPGLGNNALWFGNVLDQGPNPISFGGSATPNPGQTVTNSGTTSETLNYTYTFRVRQQLQRRRNKLWGAIPFGDPTNRPNNVVQLTSLVGSLPEQSLFTNATSGTTASLSAAGSVNAKYNLKYIDLLYPGMTTAPQPSAVLGLQLVTSSPSGLTPGNIFMLTHRTAQIYQYIHHVLVNGELPVRSDYFGLWDDQDEQSARWAYDSQRNTFDQYFDNFHRTYRRYPFTGQYLVDMVGGEFPPIPTTTPYIAAMTPDAEYSQIANIPVTPAMTTALRLPSGVTASNPYVRLYSFGLVRVPY